jgi:hypothetical protein
MKPKLDFPKIERSYKNIFLLEKWSAYTFMQIKKATPKSKLCICDFYVDKSEQGQVESWGGISFEEVLIVDHHAPLNCMARQVSSTNLADAYIRTHGPLSEDYAILINHTDADSLLSALVMGGHLPPKKYLCQAAIAADHTGEENAISDLLQSLEEERDLVHSIEVLLKLLKRRYNGREEVLLLKEQNCFHWEEKVAWIILEHKIDGEFFTAILPEAKAIISASLMPPGSPRKWRISIRLGAKVEEDLALNKMALPDFGGRWNAGSTNRSGGVQILNRMSMQRF